MKLITKQLEQKFKKHPLYSQEEAEDPVAIAKYFLPFGRGTWYVIEAQKETNRINEKLADEISDLKEKIASIMRTLET